MLSQRVADRETLSPLGLWTSFELHSRTRNALCPCQEGLSLSFHSPSGSCLLLVAATWISVVVDGLSVGPASMKLRMETHFGVRTSRGRLIFSSEPCHNHTTSVYSYPGWSVVFGDVEGA